METNTAEQQQAASQVVRWATFRLNEERYGLNVMQVREVLRYSEITPVPGTSDSILGIINLRGNVVTVLDTRVVFDLALSEVTEKTRIMIIETQDQVIGLFVDSVDDVVDIENDDIEQTPNIGNEHVSHYFQGVANKNEELLILVDVDQLVLDQTPVAVVI
jgi:purine-binding chemotaxis protein CheW